MKIEALLISEDVKEDRKERSDVRDKGKNEYSDLLCKSHRG